MGLLSNYATGKLVDHVFKAAYSPFPNTTLFLALCIADPTVAGTGSSISETDYTNYVRKAITAADFNAASLRKIVQAQDIEFAEADSVSASNITHWAICEAVTGGAMLASSAFNSPWNPDPGNTPKIASGQIEISVGASGGNGFTDLAVHLMLNLMFRDIAWPTPSDPVYIGLSTAVIADDDAIGDVTECSGGTYGRKNIPAATMDSAVAGVTANGNAKITFVTATGAWGTLTSSFIVTDISGVGGVLLAYDNNASIAGQAPIVDDIVEFDVDAFTTDLD